MADIQSLTKPELDSLVKARIAYKKKQADKMQATRLGMMNPMK